MKLPLEGIKLLDLTIYQNGPGGTVMLADMGAEVLKIEDPEKGDPGRNTWIDTPRGPVNPFFQSMNRNKQSMTLNLKTPEGREIFYRLVRTADVIAQNFRVGVTERLGVGYETVKQYNPKIIYASNSGYGSQGPDAGDGVLTAQGRLEAGSCGSYPNWTPRSPTRCTPSSAIR